MINKQFSKCPACKQDEKYVVWLSHADGVREVMVCAKQCGIDKKTKGKKC
jgi:Zn ribbon nucleic-acid-binding protein